MLPKNYSLPKPLPSLNFPKKTDKYNPHPHLNILPIGFEYDIHGFVIPAKKSRSNF
jgi:hypothetical protein